MTWRAEALSYAAMSWPVLPVHNPIPGDRCSCGNASCTNVGKHPRIRQWQQRASTDPEVIEAWCAKWPEANTGILTGAAGGIIVIDVDSRHGGDITLDELELEYGRLPDTVRSHTPGGGEHILLAHPGFPVKNDNAGKLLGHGIDVRGDNGFIVAPYGKHRNGGRYEWELSSRPGELPVAAAPAWLLERLRGIYRDTDDTDDVEAIATQDVASESPRLRVSVNNLDDAIVLTLPTALGQRNRKIFEFARALKSVDSYSNALLPTLKPAVRAWHAQALQHIGTKDFDSTWADFAHAWKRVRSPLGEDSLTAALLRADAALLPPFAEEYDRVESRRLVKLCRELQRLSGAAPFFISCRVAGEQLGIDHLTASRLLGMLVTDGVLTVARAAFGRTATRYHYAREVTL